jgi:phenylacetate-CoA ligase
MLVVRGENVYPSAIEDVLREFAEIGEFEIVVSRPKTMDEIEIVAECEATTDELTERIAALLRRKIGLRPQIRFVRPATLARTDLKSRRVRDLRERVDRRSEAG